MEATVPAKADALAAEAQATLLNAGHALLVLFCATLLMAFAQPTFLPSPVREILLVAGLLTLPAALVCYGLPVWAAKRAPVVAPAEAMPGPVDIAPIARTLGTARIQIEAATESLAEREVQLGAIRDQMALSLEERRSKEDALTERNLEIARLQSRLEGWEAVTVAFFESIQRTLSLTGLDDRDRAWAEREAKEYARLVSPVGFELIRPEPGTPFVDAFHEGVEFVPSPVAAGHVAKVVRWGYRSGDRVLQRAQVAVARPE